MSESCWDYPRPPRLEPARRRVRVLDPEGRLIVDVPPGEQATRAWRVLETSHPPTYYVAAEAVLPGAVRPAPGRSWCEWKGQASYVDLVGGDGRVLRPRAAWSYRDPTPAYAALAGALAFYPSGVRCLLDDEEVGAQEGDFYGGWVSSEVTGPFKGAPGTLGW
ncbi:DUF427 domain-containing protein [Kineococcus sp. LSe6-4]|uniref:DUF427 domain-containing protein n=1 Tax=Kineococcus halophytocola TaxID=3234027 RepID=A0ABV4H3R1_9ACTN